MIEHAGRLDAKHDVFGDCEDRHQHEVLMNHADAGSDRIPGVAETNRAAVDKDLAGVGTVTLCDPEPPTSYDLGGNYCLSEDCVDHDAGRAILSATKLDGLNPNTTVRVAHQVSSIGYFNPRHTSSPPGHLRPMRSRAQGPAVICVSGRISDLIKCARS